MKKKQLKPPVGDAELLNVHEEPEKPEDGKGPFNKKKLFWAIFFVVIAVASIWAVISQSKDFSLADMLDYIGSASFLPLFAAILCALGYIFFEGGAVRCVSRAFGHQCSLLDGCSYAAADIYFSAITPSATGGQPASAYFMIGDGMPVAVATAALLANLSMYTLSIIVIGVATFLLRPGLFLAFNTASKVLILCGSFMQLMALLLFLLLLLKSNFLHRICRSGLHLLAKLHLIRHEERKQKKLKKVMMDYRRCALMLSGRGPLLIRLFLWNLFQRVSQIAVIVFVFLSAGGDPHCALDLFSINSYAVLGTNTMPIPGAMGIFDYLLLDGLGGAAIADATNLELFSRSLSFYLCVMLCGISVVVKYWLQRRKRRIKL